MDRFRTLLRWTWIPVLLAVLYAGVTFFLRWQATRSNEEQAAAKTAEANQKVVDRYASGSLKILTFYPNPPVLKSGSQGLICYGVSDAKSVRIEPDVEPVKPSLSRCIEVKPAKTTIYTLTAIDAAGKEISQAIEVAVK